RGLSVNCYQDCGSQLPVVRSSAFSGLCGRITSHFACPITDHFSLITLCPPHSLSILHWTLGVERWTFGVCFLPPPLTFLARYSLGNSGWPRSPVVRSLAADLCPLTFWPHCP